MNVFYQGGGTFKIDRKMAWMFCFIIEVWHLMFENAFSNLKTSKQKNKTNL